MFHFYVRMTIDKIQFRKNAKKKKIANETK